MSARVCRHILWDLGNVLVPFSHGRIRKNVKDLLPLFTLLKWGWRLKEVQKRLAAPLKEYETGLIEFPDLKAALENVLGTGLDYEKLRLAWNDMFEPMGETARFALDLNGKYACHIASNTNREHMEWVLMHNPELRAMKSIQTSYGLHAVKPEMAFYEKALENIGASPEECLFIDDKEENVLGAAEAGLTALHYTNLAALCQDLLALGVQLD